MPGVVEAIYVTPAAKADMLPVPRVTAVAGRGLEGDRYFLGVGAFSRWPGEGRALTLIEAEAVEAILAETAIDLSAGRHRRNLVTRGIRLPDLMGKAFHIGGATFRGSRLCLPCRYLEPLVAPGLYAAMRGRGGLRAEIIAGGAVAVGDEVTPVDVKRVDATPMDTAARGHRSPPGRRAEGAPPSPSGRGRG
jgi:MOSC domain-containing protein YiiM